MIISFFIFFLSISTFICELPSNGKFVIMKFDDSECKSVIDVKLNPPTSPCWSTSYNNGIKPVSYNESTREITAQFYNTSNCYSSYFEEITFTCDRTCIKNSITGSYLKCSYVSFPSHANFTVNTYVDSECQYQSEMNVLKGNSHCWKIHDGLSLTPTSFNADNYKDLSAYIYFSKDCTGEYSTFPQNIECNNRCFKMKGDEIYFYRCTYMAGAYRKSNAKILMLGILLILI